MKNNKLAALLGISPGELSRKCNPQRGSYLLWLCREILIQEYARLSETDRNVLLKILIRGTSFNVNCRTYVDDLVADGYFMFSSYNLNHYAKIYSGVSPFPNVGGFVIR